MEVDVARREVERLNREISDLRDKLAENKYIFIERKL